jgi:hypothetical protein
MPSPNMTPVTDDKPPETPRSTATTYYYYTEWRSLGQKLGDGANGLGRHFGPLLGASGLNISYFTIKYEGILGKKFLDWGAVPPPPPGTLHSSPTDYIQPKLWRLS